MLTVLAAALAPHGLNLLGTTSLETYDAGVPPSATLRALDAAARTAIVIGNGGPAFWRAYRAFCGAHPAGETHPDPLDAFTRAVIEAVVPPVVGPRARYVYPVCDPERPVSFMRLAACAGLARPSRLGILIHPVFGPWVAWRAAVLVPHELAGTRPADQFDPCPGCAPRPCVAACPGAAVGPAGWDVARCAATRGRDDEPCAAGCLARIACVVGPEHRYPPDALAYHQRRARPLLVGAPGSS